MSYRNCVLSAVGIALSGCASTQLSVNTADVARSTANIEISQILDNVERFIRDPNAIPSQSLVSAGTISTTNSVSPNPSYGFTKAKQNTISATPAIQATRTIAQSLGIQASDQWTQSWNIAPVNDGDNLRRLSAIYRYKANGNLKDLIRDYPIAVTPNPDQSDVGKKNSNLANAKIMGHLYRWGKPVAMPGDEICGKIYLRSEISANEFVGLGRYGHSNLAMSQEDFNNGCLAKLVFLVHDAAGATSSASIPSADGTQRLLIAPLVVPPSIR